MLGWGLRAKMQRGKPDKFQTLCFSGQRFYLTVVYIWGGSLILLLSIANFSAPVHALLLLAAFSPILGVHLSVSCNLRGWRRKKGFLFLTLQWIGKCIFLVISEGSYFFWQKGFLIVDWIDLIFSIMIALSLSLSFLMRNPFFYERCERKYILAIGVAGLLGSSWIIFLTGLSLYSPY
jgi:MFS-type transporter involved in bile tolerance (Atg22 family)